MPRNGRVHIPRELRLLIRDNPGMEVENGTRHWKIKMNGRFLGIFPHHLIREGISPNLKAQLRRGGVRV